MLPWETVQRGLEHWTDVHKVAQDRRGTLIILVPQPIAAEDSSDTNPLERAGGLTPRAVAERLECYVIGSG